MKCFICHNVAYCHFVSIAIVFIFSISLSNVNTRTHSCTHTHVHETFVCWFSWFSLSFTPLCLFHFSISLSRNSSLYCMLHVRLQIRSQSNEAISNYFCNSNSNSTMTQVFHALFNHYKAKSFVTFSLWFHFNSFRHWLQMWRCHFVFLSMPKMNSSKQIRRTCNKKKTTNRKFTRMHGCYMTV